MPLTTAHPFRRAGAAAPSFPRGTGAWAPAPKGAADARTIVEAAPDALRFAADAKSNTRALLGGDNDHLPKPVDPGELVAAIAGVASSPPSRA